MYPKKKQTKVTRPWGSYEVVENGRLCKKKILTIRKGEHTSYQKHSGRNEVWYIEKGCGVLIIDNKGCYLKAGDHVVIPRRTAHGVMATTEELVIREIWDGDILSEHDIERIPFQWEKLNVV